jgi:hypothetical protein
MPEVAADRIGYVCVRDRNVYWEYGGRENPASRNSPSFAVALNWGIGSSSLNAEVNALERLQIVRGLNS